MRSTGVTSLRDVSAALDRALLLRGGTMLSPLQFGVSDVRLETVTMQTRDGLRLATDMYRPPLDRGPCIAVRTPYDRASDRYVGAFLSLARRGYVVVSQDCRGTGASEPDEWDYYLYEPQDSYDLVDWITNQRWFDGFIGSVGGSYVGQVQWQMAMHPAMSAIVPEVSGLGVATNTVHLHMFSNAYAKSTGKGADKVAIPYFELEPMMLGETLASGFYNEPLQADLPNTVRDRFPELASLPLPEAQRRLWAHYCALDCAARAAFVKELTGARNITVIEVEWLSEVFGAGIAHDRHTLPHVDMASLSKGLHAPALIRTGWYDWGLNDALATWELITQSASEPVRSQSRLLITPSAHNMPGYHEGVTDHPELHHAYAFTTSLEAQLQWFETVRRGEVGDWPRVIYYLMGANHWCAAEQWPPANARLTPYYLHPGGGLAETPPTAANAPDRYRYDPENPTPTVGGGIVSYVYPPGSVDVSEVQTRADVLCYTTPPLDHDLDVVGPLKAVIHVASSAVDTDFVIRISDVFPDGRAIQLQNGALRARFRNIDGEPSLLEPGKVYALEIDMWATANRFRPGHRLRIDISSADFPRFDRNTNLGGSPGRPVIAEQTLHHDPEHPSHVLIPVLGAPDVR